MAPGLLAVVTAGILAGSGAALANSERLPISIQIEPSGLIQVGEEVRISAKCSDAQGETITYKFTQGSMNGPEGPSAAWSRTFTTPGEFRVTVTAHSPSGRKGHDAASIVVRGENLPPQVKLSVDKPVASRGEPVTYTAQGTDPEKWSLRYQFLRDEKVLQEGHKAQFTETYSDLGEHAIDVRAIDPEGASATARTSVVIVNQPPRIIVGGPSGGPRHQALPLDVTALDPDQDQVAIMYQVEGSKDWKPWDGNLQFSEPGPRTINFQGHDSHGATSLVTPYHVEIANAPPLLDLLPQDSTTPRRQPLKIEIAVSDPDRDRVSLSSDHPGLSITPESVSFSSDQLGPHTVNITASDPYGGEVTKTLELEVINQNPTGKLILPKEVVRYQPAALGVEASDPDGDDLFYSFSINQEPWTEYLPHSEHMLEFADPGKYPVSVRIRDQHSGLIELSDSISVSNSAPRIDSVEQPSQVFRGEGVRLSVLAEDPENDPIEFEYSVNKSPPVSSPYPSFIFLAENLGPTEVQITATDRWGGKTSQLAVIEVANRPPRLVLSASPPDWHGNINIRGWAEDPDGDQTSITMASSHGTILAQEPGRWLLQTAHPQEVFVRAQALDNYGGITTESLRLVTNRQTFTGNTAITLNEFLYPNHEAKYQSPPQELYQVLGGYFDTHFWLFQPPAWKSTVKWEYLLKHRNYPAEDKTAPFKLQQGKWQYYEVTLNTTPGPKNKPISLSLQFAPAIKKFYFIPPSPTLPVLPSGPWQRYKQ